MRAVLSAVGVLLCASVAWAAGDNPWPSFDAPAPGPARAIGGYSKGCLQGAVELPLDGEGYQVMRPSRRRYYGHPVLVDYVKGLSASFHAARKSLLLIGDLSQPRGGRSNGGHSSHQTGLDVDIWFWRPPVAEKRSLSERQRERIEARSVVDVEQGTIVAKWKKRVATILRLAAQDAHVARIFVNPIIKRELCEDLGERPGKKGRWLRKLRPWYGHDDHFHVRLQCPEESTDCEPQAEVGQGTGCDALDFWFDEEAQEKRRKSRRRYQKSVDEGQGWPDACAPLLQ